MKFNKQPFKLSNAKQEYMLSGPKFNTTWGKCNNWCTFAVI